MFNLEKYEELPFRENLSQSLVRRGTNPWEYADNKCIYHRNDYGDGYNFAIKLFDKNVGKDAKQVVHKLKNNPKYKHLHFFRRGVDNYLEYALGVATWWYNVKHFVDKKTNIIHLLPQDKPKERKQSNVAKDVSYTTTHGGVLESRKGIFYLKESEGYWESYWNEELQLECHREVLAKYTQLSSYWLKHFDLTNFPEEF